MLKPHSLLTLDMLHRFVDNMYDELLVYDKNYKVVYVNKAGARHYGLVPQDVMRTDNFWVNGRDYYWTNSVLPSVYRTGQPVRQEQKTCTGVEMLVIAIPLFDENGELEYVVTTARDSLHEKTIPRATDIDLTLNTVDSQHMDKGLVFHSNVMRDLRYLIKQVASHMSPCLFIGETGSGKSLMAKYMHANSPRASRPFVVVNCASIPTELFESELFGHVRGAFTGAVSNQEGLFSQAEGGVLFLDEISELPHHMQAKLLHVVQENEYRPVGCPTVRCANVKLVAASNRNLEDMISAGRFREDLYYRLNVFQILIPPLRQRQDDIPPLVQYYLNFFGEKYESYKVMDEAALRVLYHYTWRGNVRQLAHVIESLVGTVSDRVITPSHLPSFLYESPILSPEATPPALQSASHNLAAALGACEGRLVREAYARSGSSRGLARALGITQTRAMRLIHKYVRPAASCDTSDISLEPSAMENSEKIEHTL